MHNDIHIGDVIICSSDKKSPYGGHSLIGEPRITALKQFKAGELPAELTAWYAPCHGGARILIDDSEVNWETSGLE